MQRERKQRILEKLASKAKILAMSDDAIATLMKTNPVQATRMKAIRAGKESGSAAAKVKPGAERDALISKGQRDVGISRAVVTPQPRSPGSPVLKGKLQADGTRAPRDAARDLRHKRYNDQPYRGVGGKTTASSNIGVTDEMARLTSQQAAIHEKLRLFRKGRFARGAESPLDPRRVRPKGGNLGTPGALRS